MCGKGLASLMVTLCSEANRALDIVNALSACEQEIKKSAEVRGCD